MTVKVVPVAAKVGQAAAVRVAVATEGQVTMEVGRAGLVINLAADVAMEHLNRPSKKSSWMTGTQQLAMTRWMT